METSTAKKLTLLSYFAFWDRFIYYGAFTILVLYLTESLHLSQFNTYSIWGVFAILGYSLPVLGGIIGDRWLTREQCILYGALGLFAGNLLLFLLKGPGFFLGVSCLLCGMGLLKTNLATYVGQLSIGAKSEKSSHYNFYFIGMVLGATLGPALFGFFAKAHWWYSGFLISAIGSLSIFVISIYALNFQLKHSFSKHWKSGRDLLLFIASMLIVSSLFEYASRGQMILGVGIVVVIAYLIFVCLKSASSERLKIIYIVLLSFLCLPHFLGALQVDGSFSLFIQNHLNHSLFGWKVPTLEFSAIEPLSGAIIAPIIAILWLKLERSGRQNIRTHWKVLVGSCCSFAAFGVMMFLSSNLHTANSHMAIWYVVAANILIGMGDVLIIPTMMSAVSFYAPHNLKGTLMGFWFMSDALSGLFASILARNTDPSRTHHANLAEFHHSFSEISMILLMAVVVLLVLLPLLRRLVR